MVLSKMLSTQYKILRIHVSSRDSVLFWFSRIVQRQTKYLEIVMFVKGGEINKKRGKGSDKEQKIERISSKIKKICTQRISFRDVIHPNRTEA